LEEEKPLDDPVEFWRTHFRHKEIFIVTHPDMDHLSGLYRLVAQERVPILNFWDTHNHKNMTTDDFSDGPYDYRDWEQYQTLRNSHTSPRVLRLHRCDEGNYWTDDGVTILSPTHALEKLANDEDNWNHLSYVLRIQHDKSVVILTGDPSQEALQDVCETFPDDFLKADLLCAPHHGRDTGYYQPFVKAVSPKYTIVSVGKKPENDASNKYRQYSECVFSTRFHGTMHAKCWSGGDIWLYDHQGRRLS